MVTLKIMLMLKEAGATGECTYSHAPVSSFDFPVYFSSLAGEPMTNEYAADMLSLKDDEKRTRYLFRNSTDNSKLVVDKYSIDEDVSNYKAMKKEDEFVEEGEVVPYELGERLGFDIDNNGNAYATEGFADNHGFRTRLRGPVSTLVIPFKEIPKKKITCNIEVHSRSDVSLGMKCIVKANGVEVYQGTVDREMISNGIVFDIEPSLFKDENLQIDFLFPELPEEEMKKKVIDRTTTISLISIVME